MQGLPRHDFPAVNDVDSLLRSHKALAAQVVDSRLRVPLRGDSADARRVEVVFITDGLRLLFVGADEQGVVYHNLVTPELAVGHYIRLDDSATGSLYQRVAARVEQETVGTIHLVGIQRVLAPCGAVGHIDIQI